MTDEATPSKPLLRIVHGDPTPEELAALTAVIAARAAAVDERPETGRFGWTDPGARLRTPIRTGTGAWVASGRVPGTRTRAHW